jgi:hypothetical protein
MLAIVFLDFVMLRDRLIRRLCLLFVWLAFWFLLKCRVILE